MNTNLSIFQSLFQTYNIGSFVYDQLEKQSRLKAKHVWMYVIPVCAITYSICAEFFLSRYIFTYFIYLYELIQYWYYIFSLSGDSFSKDDIAQFLYYHFIVFIYLFQCTAFFYYVYSIVCIWTKLSAWNK